MSREAFSALVSLVAAIATTVVVFAAARHSHGAMDPDMNGLETAILAGIAGLVAALHWGTPARKGPRGLARLVAIFALGLAIASTLCAWGTMTGCLPLPSVLAIPRL